MKCPHCQGENPETSRFCADCGTQLGAPQKDGVLQTQTLQPFSKMMMPGTVFAGKYKILGELGRGGMGEVYLAEDTTLARRVALKLLPEETYQNSEARQRFIREARAAAALDHPYICSIHEVGESEGRLFFVMEYVKGQTLRDRIAQGPIPLKQALQIATEAAEALQGAHEKGLIHRDIKPANIMLTEKGHAKVMDFGLAKPAAGAEKAGAQAEASTSLTQDGIAPGTPAYMSPEQLQGKPLDQRSDIFSFGMVLYEMMSGIHPFKRETGFTTISAILNEKPRPVADFVKGAPEPLQLVISKMLTKDAGERYQSVHDVLIDLKEVQFGLPADWKARKFLRPARLAAASVVLAVTIIAAGWLAKTLFFKSPAEALAFQERDWILITDFENLTGEQVFDGSLETALSVGIQQSQYVNVFPRSRVQETLKRMRREDIKKVDETVGREVALREGIKGLLACQISRIGEEYQLTGRIVDPNTQVAVFSHASRAKGKDEVLSALDDLAKKVRLGLGESLSRISQQRLPLPRATTSSLEALKFYTEGRFASGNTAYKLLQQAIELDPDFALAHAELGMKYFIDSNRPKGEEHFQKALSLLDRLTTREQLWIRAIVEDWRGNRDQGIENYKAYLAQYPDDSGAWYRLGYAYLISQSFELGIEAFQKVIGIDGSSSAAYVNIATCYNSLGNAAEALENYQKAFQLGPEWLTGVFVNNEYGFLLVKMGKIQEAAQVFEKMVQLNDPGKKAKGYRSLGLLDMYRGRYSSAQGHFQEAVILNKTLKSGLSELRDHLYLAAISNLKGRREGFEKEMVAVKQIQKEIKIDPYFLSLVGRTYARAGRHQEAALQLKEMEARLGDVLAVSGVGRSNQSDQAAFHLLKGEVELTEKKYEEAVNSFLMAARLGRSDVEENLAYAFLQKGDTDKAIEKYLEFLKIDALGYEPQESWILAHYELGKLYKQKGQFEDAAKSYGRFLEIWKDADPDLAVLADAKKRLSRLKGGPQTPKT